MKPSLAKSFWLMCSGITILVLVKPAAPAGFTPLVQLDAEPKNLNPMLLPTPNEFPVYNDACFKDLHLFNYESLICNNSSYTDPKFYHVSRTNIKCVSRHPIRWDVFFTPPLKNNAMRLGGIPYEVKSSWKSCLKINKTLWNSSPSTRKIYFESVLVFPEAIMHQYSHVIDIRCVNIRNSTESTETWSATFNRTINLSGGKGKLSQEVLLQKPALLSCPDVTLVSDTSLSKFSCLIKNHSNMNTTAVEYLECKDWVNCQQIASQKFKNICKGTWNQTYCNSNAHKCGYHNYSAGISSGIVYCTTGADTVFYVPFFRSKLANAEKYLDIIGNSKEDSDTFVDLKMSLSRKPSHDWDAQFKCSAPKFLALEGFEWTSGSPNIIRTEACTITRNDTGENYVENFKCKIRITDKLPRELKVACTVNFHSGLEILKTTIQNITLESQNERKRTEEFQATLGFGGAIAGYFVVIALVIFICCYVRMQRRKKRLVTSEEGGTFKPGSCKLSPLASRSEETQTVEALPCGGHSR